ncbi:MAG: ppx-GppA [Deltaproteobacteria bacterium]|nr:ppx-GppA [Deltaproteobacteria bacterium]
MRLAAIDIGTNTLRMMVADREGTRIRPLARYQRIIGLGRRMRDTGEIGEDEFRGAIETLRSFRGEMDRLGVDACRACGTACLREASNRDRFLAEAGGAGIGIEVIGPAEEGRLVWKGIRTAIAGRPGDIAMDVGGGSTEFTAGAGEGETISLPIGVVVLSTLLPLSDPPLPWEWKALSHYAERRIGDGTAVFGRRRNRRLIGTAGTFTTLLALDRKMTRYEPDRINGARLAKDAVLRWAERLAGMTDAQRLRLPGMEKGRERYMVPGMALICAAIRRFGADGLTVSDAGLLEGIIAGIGGNGTSSNPLGEGQ